MASIDAFWELAAGESVTKTAQRVSLRCLAPAATPAINRRAKRQHVWILGGVALLHVLFVLALRAAMHPLAVAHHEASMPLQITFIERRPVLVVPTHIATPPALVVPPHGLPQPRPLPPPPPPIALRMDALQAVTIESPVKQVETAPPRAVLFDTDGALRVSQAPQPSYPRNLLAHRNVSFMLPGGARTNSPDFRVRSIAPRDVVNSVGRYFSNSLTNAAHATRFDSHGVEQVAADRGLRTSGRDSDPCEDIALDMVDLNDATTRDQAEARYEKSCEGH